MDPGSGPVASFNGRLNMQPTRYGDLIRPRRRPRPGWLGGARGPPAGAPGGGATAAGRRGTAPGGRGKGPGREGAPQARPAKGGPAPARGCPPAPRAGGQRRAPRRGPGVRRAGPRAHPAAAKLRDGKGEGRSVGSGAAHACHGHRRTSRLLRWLLCSLCYVQHELDRSGYFL